MKPTEKRRRWLQFSLRTLLVVTLLIAAAAAWLSSEIRRAKRQEAAVEALREDGATVMFAHERIIGFNGSAGRLKPIVYAESQPGPVWLRECLGVDLFSRVASVDIVINSPKSLQFETQSSLLGDVTSVESASLTYSTSKILGISDVAMEPIAALPNLRRFSLGRPDETMSLMGLQRVPYDNIELSDAAWLKLGENRSIKSLSLFGVRLNDRSMKHLAEMPSLSELEIESAGSLADATTIGIDRLHGLTRLRLVSYWLTAKSLPNIAALSRLEDLTLNINLNDDVIRELAGMRQLRRLKLLGALQTDVEGLLPLAELANLQKLEFELNKPSHHDSRAFQAFKKHRPDVELIDNKPGNSGTN